MEESEACDFTRALNTDSFLKKVCAMANTRGGIILLGIEDSRKASGRDRLFGIHEKNPEMYGQFLNALRTRLQPALQEASDTALETQIIPCQLKDGKEGEVAIVQVPETHSVVSIIDGGTYARFGSTNRQLSGTEIVQLEYSKGKRSYIDETVDIDLDLLDTPTWRIYKEERRITHGLEKALLNIGLAKKDKDGQIQAKMAAVLLFAEFPGNLLQRKCAIRIFHYKGHRIEHEKSTNLFTKPRTFDGPLIQQIEEASRYLKERLELGLQTTTGGFEVEQSYPFRVIQEAVTNAVIHRDYYQNRDIHIRVFNNRIEVESPGGFPYGVEPSNIEECGSHPRNIALTDHLREFPNPPNLDAGEGVKMMFQETKLSKKLPPAFFELENHSVQVVLKNEALLPEWELIEDYLKKNETITNQEAREILNKSANQVSKLLSEWSKQDRLFVLGESRKHRKYQLKTGYHHVMEGLNLFSKYLLEQQKAKRGS